MPSELPGCCAGSPRRHGSTDDFALADVSPHAVLTYQQPAWAPWTCWHSMRWPCPAPAYASKNSFFTSTYQEIPLDEVLTNVTHLVGNDVPVTKGLVNK